VPLRLSTYLGLFSAFAAVLMEILILYCRMFTNSNLNSFVPALDLRLALYDRGLVPALDLLVSTYTSGCGKFTVTSRSPINGIVIGMGS
jgi:hypothetical protein